MSTNLGDHTYPGNKIRQYADQKLKYIHFRREDDRRKKPTGILRCKRKLRELGSRCQYSFGPGGIFTNDEFKQSYWNISPNTMNNWLPNDQNIDLLDPAAPFDVDEITDQPPPALLADVFQERKPDAAVKQQEPEQQEGQGQRQPEVVPDGPE